MTSKIKVDNIADQDDNNIINESGDVITVGAAGDTVAVAGNIVKSNAYQASDGGSIISQSGTTITIGASGDTVSLASGASQSGFGRSGSVDWQTGSIKTATFTAASGEGYFCNTSGGAFTVNLPAGSAGAIVSVSDYTRSFNSNNLTISPNGSEKVGGIAGDVALSVNGQAATFVYVDGTEGWINVQNAEDTETGLSPFITATGGTITTSGDYKIHTFTGPGTFTVCNVSTTSPAPGNNTVSYMVVAGGGGGGAPPGLYGGGGGAGGFREYKGPTDSYTASPLDGNPGGTAVTVTAQAYPITVGGGGSGQGAGNNSIFSSITSAGGGRGGRNYPSPFTAGNGGSGGGMGTFPPNSGSAGSGNTPPVSPPQGQPGAASTVGAGGGGGATAAGSAASPPINGGPGGAGATTSITGSPTAYAGGGGGSSWKATGGTGGTGGGGNGNTGGACVPSPSFSPQTAGGTNTGGGGGSGGADGGSGPSSNSAGGSGIVVIRYKFQ